MCPEAIAMIQKRYWMWLTKCVRILTRFVMTGIVFLLLFSRLSYSSFHTREYDFPNVLLLLCGTGILWCLWQAADRMPVGKKWNLLASAGLLCIQLGIVKSALFCTGWDAGTVWNDAYQTVFGEPSGQAVNWSYFDTYPNNRLLLVVLIHILRVCRILGVESTYHLYALAVALQCLLLALTGYVLFDFICHCTGQRRKAWFGWFVYAGWIGLSPWMMIVYSDVLGILFPITILWIYVRLYHSKYWIRWMAVGLVSAIGYRMNATCSIMLIALIFSEFVLRPLTVMNDRTDQKERKLELICEMRKTVFSLLLVVVCFIGIRAVVDWEYSHLTKTPVDHEATIGFAHYFKMGLNQSSTGTFNYEDVDASLRVSGASARNKENLREAFDRIQKMGFFQTGLLYCRKTKMNYNDGSFGYGLGGQGFVETDYAGEKGGAVASCVREIFRPGGRYFHWYLDLAQSVWLSLLAGVVAAVWKRNNKNCVFELALLGIWMFTTLFEGQQRYVFLYAPVFIIIAVCSWGITGKNASITKFME